MLQIVLKTIAGFLNGEGGVLLIGVNNDGSINGLEQDLALLKNKNLDEFELRLKNGGVSSKIGTFFLSFIHTRFEVIEDKTVCIVSVERSSKPAFLIDQKDNNRQLFYVRTGNLTEEMKGDHMASYLSKRWG